MPNHILYGAPGWGSVIAEAALTLCRVPYDFEDVSGFDSPGAARERLQAINPLVQVPTLLLPNGEVMTESVAIVLLLAEQYPRSGLAPPAGAVERPQFLRRLVWMTAALYPTWTFEDYPDRWSNDPAVLQLRVGEHRRNLWRSFEAERQGRAWAIGNEFSAVDIYVSVMTRWRPGRDWFRAECPTLYAIARKIDDLETLKPIWTRNFP